MADIEIELPDRDLDLLGNSAQSLRRMRHAAVCSPFLRDRHQIKEETEPLEDAEQLVLSSSGYLMSVISGTTNDAERTIWEGEAINFATKYHPFKPISKTSEPFMQIGYAISSMLFRIGETWESELRFFLDECKLPLKPSDFLDNNLGIFVPLAGDYYQLAVLREYIALRVNPNCFRVKPIALSKGLKVGTLPKERGGELSLDSCSRLGVLVDAYDSGKTYKRALWFVGQHFPNRDIIDSNP